MLKIEDHKNNLIVLVYFNRSISSLKKKRVHDFSGGIYHNDFGKDKQKEFFEEKIRKEPEEKYKIASIEGSYLEELYINNKLVYDFRSNSPCKFLPYFPYDVNNEYSKYSKTNHLVLPSDSRYREDLIWLKRGFLEKESFSEYSVLSGKWKLILEAQQRIDRENRKEIKDEIKKEEDKKKKEENKKNKKGIISSIYNSFKKS
jgi:hypothetical protein